MLKFLTEKDHSNFMLALMVQGGMKRIRLPEEFRKLSIGKQIAGVKAIIQQHCTEQRGKTVHFGNITGYRFHRNTDECYDFSTDGELLSMNLTEGR